MKLLWVVTCICCTLSISVWNLYTHTHSHSKGCQKHPTNKKINKKKHNTFSRSGYQKVKPPKNHTKHTKPTNTSHQGPNPPFQTSPPNRSSSDFFLLRNVHQGDGTSALLIHGIFIAFRFQQHSQNVHIAKLCCCRHGRTTMLILSWCDVMSLSERKNGSGEYEFYCYEWGCDCRFLNEIRCFPYVGVIVMNMNLMESSCFDYIYLWMCSSVIWIQWIFSWKVIPFFTQSRHVGKNLCNQNL